MRTIFRAIIMVMGIFFISGANVFAEDTKWQEDYKYKLDRSRSYIRLGDYKGDAAELTVPAKAIINDREYTTYIAGKDKGNSRYETSWSSDPNLKVLRFEKGIVLDPCLKSLFEGCAELEVLDVSTFDTSSVTDMRSMFYKCISLKAIDVSSFDTSNVEKMNTMFLGCMSLETIDISGFNLKSIKGMERMFEDCHKLTSIKLPPDIPFIDERFFYNCEALKEQEISSSVRTIGEAAFVNTGLRSIYLPKEVTGFGAHCIGYTYKEEYELIPDFLVHADADSDGYAYAKENELEAVCINHVPEVIPAVPATETSTGLTEGSKCSKCGEILKAQQVVPKLPHTHTLVILPGVEPTAKSTGLTKGKKCLTCGKIITAQKVIPKLSFGLNLSNGGKKSAPSYALVGKKIPLKIDNIKDVKILAVKWKFKKKKYKKYATLTHQGNTGILKLKKSGKGKTINVVAEITYRYKGSSNLASVFSLHSSSSGSHATVSYKIKGTGTKVKSLKIKRSKTVLKIGKSTVFRAVTKPKKVEKNRISWSSKNQRVATVSSSGKVKARKRGEAVIVCICPTGTGKRLKATKKIKVR